MLVLPFCFTALVGYWYWRRSGLATGYVLFSFSRVLKGSGTQSVCLFRTIRLPGGDAGYRYSNDSGIVATLASVPWFLVGLAGIAWGWVSSNVESLGDNFRSRRGYRNIPVDEDAQILRFEDEEQ